jgi:hypothetical protein
MLLQKPIDQVFVQLQNLLNTLTDGEYQQASTVLNGSSVGQHVRHTIELFQCLQQGYNTGIVNYENRKRDPKIETDKTVALALLTEIATMLQLPNKPLLLHSLYEEQNSEGIQVATNFYREIVYNLEHTIHHMALIRIGVQDVTNIKLKDNFGVAPSTIQHRNACVQ